MTSVKEDWTKTTTCGYNVLPTVNTVPGMLCLDLSQFSGFYFLFLASSLYCEKPCLLLLHPCPQLFYA